MFIVPEYQFYYSIEFEETGGGESLEWHTVTIRAPLQPLPASASFSTVSSNANSVGGFTIETLRGGTVSRFTHKRIYSKRRKALLYSEGELTFTQLKPAEIGAVLSAGLRLAERNCRSVAVPRETASLGL